MSLYPRSALTVIRLGQTKQVQDPETGEIKLEDTDLVNRAKAEGFTDEELLLHSMKHEKIAERFNEKWFRQVTQPSQQQDCQVGAYLDQSASANKYASLKRNALGPSGTCFLELLQSDIYQEICGVVPLLGLEYMWIMARFILLFMRMEHESAWVRNSLLVQDRVKKQRAQGRRVGLVMLALIEQDEECLEAMARVLRDPPMYVEDHLFWDGLDLRHYERLVKEATATGEEKGEQA